MEIVYASDDKFAWIMGVSMLSLMDNNQSIDSIRFHVLDDGINEENLENLTSIVKKYGRECVFYQIHDTVEAVMKGKKTPRGSISMFSRLFVGNILPGDLKKVLYIDCDTIVLGNLTEFWNIDFEDNILIAVNDCFSKLHRKWIYLREDDAYFNSGVMLIDMNRWRNFNTEVKIIEAIKCFSELPYGDQCLLNTVLSHKTKITHPKYNCLPYPWGVSYQLLLKLRRPSFYYTQTEFNEASISPVIVHFATFFLSPRPWTNGWIQNSFHEKWRYYLSISPWKSHKLLPESRKLRRVFIIIYHLLPTTLSVSITGLLHAHIVPLTGILKRRKFSWKNIQDTTVSASRSN
jgi:lipopolysaccharide biosynthesis glycosyltransferase